MCAEKVCCGPCCSSGSPPPLTGPGRRDSTNPTQLGRKQQPPLTPQSTSESKKTCNTLFSLCFSSPTPLPSTCTHETFISRALLVSCQSAFPHCCSRPHPSTSSHCLLDSLLPFSCAGSTFGPCCGCSSPGFAFFVWVLGVPPPQRLELRWAELSAFLGACKQQCTPPPLTCPIELLVSASQHR